MKLEVQINNIETRGHLQKSEDDLSDGESLLPERQPFLSLGGAEVVDLKDVHACLKYQKQDLKEK